MTAQDIADVPLDIANYRVLIYEQSIRGSKTLAGDLERAIHELLAALDRTNNPLQEVLSQRSPIGVKKAPLAKFVDLADLPGRMRQWLVDHNVVYAEDVPGIDSRSLAEAPGLGKVALGKFLAAILEMICTGRKSSAGGYLSVWHQDQAQYPRVLELTGVTTASTGAPNSGAVRYPSRSARRRPAMRNVSLNISLAGWSMWRWTT